MPPWVALILCLGFVVFLLRLESRNPSGTTRVVWLPTIWMLYTASRPIGVWFPKPGRDSEFGSPLDRGFLVGLIILALILLFRRKFEWKNLIRKNSWLFVLVLYLLTSVLWTSIPSISMRRSIREMPAFLMAFLILSEPSPKKALETVLRRTSYVLIPISFLLIKYFPLIGREYETWSGSLMWRGVAIQKNGLGRICLIVAFFLAWSIIERYFGHRAPQWKYQDVADLLILSITLVLLRGPGGGQYSATAVISLALGAAAYLGLRLLGDPRLKIVSRIFPALVISLILIGTISVFKGGSNLSSFTRSAGRDTTLTGRTELWAHLLPQVYAKPLTGWGFGGFWTTGTYNMFGATEAHNGYLDILLQLGILGLTLMSIFLLATCKKALQELPNDFGWGALWTCFLIMFLISNITESSIQRFSTQFAAIILFFSVASTDKPTKDLTAEV